MTGLSLFWFGLVSASFLVFFLLDGYDLGMGMVLPFISDREEERGHVLDVIWPLWDGNEVWAVIGGAFLYAVFPRAFVALLGGLAPWVALVLVALMLRTVSFEAWHRDASHRRAWEYVQAGGSCLLVLGLGGGAGNLLEGLPLSDSGTWEGGLLSPFRPYPLALALLAMAASLYHGCLYLRTRCEGGLRARVENLAHGLVPWLGLLAALVLAWSLWLIPEGRTRGLVWIGAGLSALAGLVSWLSLRAGREGSPFFWSCLAIGAAWLAGSALLFPWLSRPGTGTGGLGIAEAAAPSPGLAFLGPLATLALVVTGGYTLYIHRILKVQRAKPGKGRATSHPDKE